MEIAEPEVYDAGSHLLDWFWQMDSLCGGNGFGGTVPLDAQRILAWSQLTRSAIEPWEADILMDMSRARQAGPEEATASEAPASQAINPAMFDALFG